MKITGKDWGSFSDNDYDKVKILITTMIYICRRVKRGKCANFVIL